MTLIELVVTIAVVGAIATVLAAAVTVTFRQQEGTRSTADIARWEQALALWLPPDLSSATSVSADHLAPPLCGSAACTEGWNALLLSWNDGSGTTTVSYRYAPSDDDETWVLNRVECAPSGGCSSHTVLRDLAAPADDWDIATEGVPDTVIRVATPDDPEEGEARPARLVEITVNGANDGGGGERSSGVTVTAGGAALLDLDDIEFEDPQQFRASSGCGGPITLVVDESGSITNTNIDNSVKPGIRDFVKEFDGTSTLLQIIRFDTVSSTLGAGGGWNRFFDLTNPSDVQALIGADGASGLVSDLRSSGGTNWEDALHRTFYTEDGQPYAPDDEVAPQPEIVIFFTDGVPTFDRDTSDGGHRSDTGSVGPPPIPDRFNYKTASGDDLDYGAEFSPRGWFRADHIVGQFRSPDIRLIGVGVGPAFGGGAATQVQRAEWPFSNGVYDIIPNEVFLGDLLAGGDPSQHGSGGGSGGYIVREYSDSDGWGDVTTADILVTGEFSKFGDALSEIALAECGGTLTVQTRDTAGSQANTEVTYQIDDRFVTTTPIVRAATFDVPMSGSSVTVELVPEPLEQGLTAQSWACRAGGADLVDGSDYSLREAGNPAAGIVVTVRVDKAVSCTMTVAP